MELPLLGQAATMFAVTNVDDLVVLAVFFGHAAAHGTPAWRVVAGQYLGFAGMLAVSIVGALGAELLPRAVLSYLGIVPIALGLRAARRAWKERRHADGASSFSIGTGRLPVAAVTFANGADNIGVYVPVFAVAGGGSGRLIQYTIVFLIGVAIWCVAGWRRATRPLVAKTLARWGHVVPPVVLIAVGVLVLFDR